jgi:quinol-cytochrome oxidoreductase complex cytochrome b subunit
MAGKEREIIRDPKYAPPYPQAFYPFWPKHAIRASVLILILFLVVFLLACYYRVPTDPNMPPLPDDGANIPAPEWYLLFLFQPFWHLVGNSPKLLSVGTFWLPLLALIFLFVVPVVFKRRKQTGVRISTAKKVILATSLWIIWGAFMAGVVGAGHHAKTTGCASCHNPMMGVRQALPPADMAEFYRVERARQIAVGKYRVGDENAIGASYKDANWQLRHFYEPTMTW